MQFKGRISRFVLLALAVSWIATRMALMKTLQ
jgi:hypothetical protein